MYKYAPGNNIRVYCSIVIIIIILILTTQLEIVLQVSDECGLLPAHLIEGGPTSQLIQVSFTPRYNNNYIQM